MTLDKWKLDYIDYLHSGRLDEAINLKRQNIPSKLYRFEKYEKNRIDTLLRNSIYVSHPDNFDDPYDAKGYYWNEIDLQRCFDGKTRDVPVKKYVKEIKKIVQDWFKNCWIGCFTEDMNNFPLWYYYADKYTGFCVEYDFSCLPQHNLFQQRLQPVIYLKQKFNLTLSLEAVCDPEKVINNEPVPSYWLHMIGNLIKNESWEFEKEWRYVSYDGITKEGGKEVNLPVKPTHIYCGKDMAEENYEVMLKAAESLGCECSKIRLNSFEDREFIVC